MPHPALPLDTCLTPPARPDTPTGTPPGRSPTVSRSRRPGRRAEPYDWSVEVPEWRDRLAPLRPAPATRAPQGLPATHAAPRRPHPAPASVLTRRGRLALTAAIALLLAGGYTLLVLAAGAVNASTANETAPGQPGDPAAPTVTVERGDTLWSIAEQVRPDTDPRRTVLELVQLNRLADSDLEPGQELRVPES